MRSRTGKSRLISWLNPAGGLRYHLRAWRYRKLWEPFRRELAGWLADWETPATGLILFGPSAGYCLDAAFLERFDEIVCVDPDPLARALWRHGKAAWSREDVFADRFPERFAALIHAYPGHAILFCNLIGQLPFLLGENALARVRERLPGFLSGRSWASFHDRVSGEPRARIPARVDCPSRLQDAEILARFYRGMEGELIDHGTEGFLPPNLPCAYLRWDLTAQRAHLIEAVRGQR